MIGDAKVDLKSFTFKIMTGKELRKSLKGLHDLDTVLCLVQKIDSEMSFKQESRSQEVVIIGIEKVRP